MPFLSCNGARLFYSDTGQGKETLFFSHGLLFTHDMFRNQVKYFSGKGFRCIAYDHRGQGQSEVTADGYDMDTLSEDAAAMIQELQVAPVHFAGLSMGGFVGMRLAARKPSLLKSLCLLETSADKEISKLRYRFMVLLVKLFGPGPIINPLMKIMFGKSSLEDPAKSDLCKEMAVKFSQLPRSITKAVNGIIDRQSVYQEIAGIHLPTLIMVGKEDKAAIPEKSERIHHQVKGSKLIYLEHAGHSSVLEEPEQVNRHLEEFLLKLV